MYSDMSMRTIASSSPNRNSASVRASSVFPTPEGPRKMNDPVGRFGSFRPARERRMAFETASMAASCPMTRLWSSSSMRMSFWVSASVSLKTGMPVHMETMSAISSSPISGRSPDSPERHCSSSSRFLLVSWRSLSRRFAAFSNSCASIAASLSRRVGDADAVVLLVAVAEPLQDLDGVVLGGLVHADLLEAALERGVALEVLAVLVQRGRADRLELAAGERRLQDAGRVDRALGGAGADEVVELVDEQDDVAALGDLLHHLLEALLELAAVLRAGHERGQVERVDLLVLQQLGHLAVRDQLGEALDHGGLADARLADQNGVVLLAAREDLHDPLDLGLAAHDRVELALGGELCEVAAELVEQLRGLLALALRAGGRARAALAASGAGEHADDLVADLLGVGVEVEQDAGGQSLVLAQEAKQDVRCADVVVLEDAGLLLGEDDDLSGPFGEALKHAVL